MVLWLPGNNGLQNVNHCTGSLIAFQDRIGHLLLLLCIGNYSVRIHTLRVFAWHQRGFVSVESSSLDVNQNATITFSYFKESF